ncbi:scavenger receptor class B member 1 isoform X1 [Bufo gargarizans]|uniref:scavenger receptor class B member 1 isoform X1 n=1 Tax=Bufo gargarizans TaxID=30331 RepID=UPI001CF2C0A1|nr:scavenger receptor class B member 1 isoform X1 [Bufo gargarizans]XP_044131589.1 scavenger receptor class B member 1 isoform X1 [Bufo gargarizans]
MVSGGNKAPIILGVVGLLLVALGALLVFLVPVIMKQQVEKNVRIDPSSGFAYEMWRDLPVPFFMSIYVFEVMNPKEITLGEKPRVEERGPYVYRERKQKTNITFNENGTVSFVEIRSFQFDREKSAGSEDDYVLVPNLIVMISSLMTKDMSYAVRFMLNAAFLVYNQEPFMNRTVKEVLWGYSDPFLDFVNTIVPNALPFKGKFGLFADFNNSNTGVFTVNTGVEDISKVQMLDTWNGLREVAYWHSEQANMLNGTAGQMWPPFRTPSQPLEFYSPDACRSMKLVYEKEESFRGIPTYRYTAPNYLFANGSDYPPNKGFCPCVASGVMNVSSCRFNAPLFLSFPHFYNADPGFVEAVDGLHPSEKLHSLFLDLHPLTGIPMNCSIKMQLSLLTMGVSGITQIGNIKPVIFPILWFSESGYLDGPVYHTYYNTLIVLPAVLDYLQYIFIALGLFFILVSAVLAFARKEKFCLFWRSNKKLDENYDITKAQKEKLTASNGTVVLEAKL